MDGVLLLAHAREPEHQGKGAVSRHVHSGGAEETHQRYVPAIAPILLYWWLIMMNEQSDRPLHIQHASEPYLQRGLCHHMVKISRAPSCRFVLNEIYNCRKFALENKTVRSVRNIKVAYNCICTYTPVLFVQLSNIYF